MSNQDAPTVVILVDNKKRDLDQASLIAFHLRSLGIRPVLEPLEAFRAVLAADRPQMIVFNHLFASHLVAWSKRLADLGVLTAVLSNEGMYLREGSLGFNSGRFHRDGHVDLFLCWNRVHQQALKEEGTYQQTRIEVIGVPRFDFYFQPWSQIVHRPVPRTSSKPRLLACTNFGLARFKELPPEHGDKFFAGWASRMDAYKDYWGAIESHWRSRGRFLEYISTLVSTGRYEITLRPHPTEDPHIYRAWLEALPQADRQAVRLDTDSNITSLILDCDLEISGESCTTAVESWIAGKPTVELLFDQHPMLFAEERSRGNIHCDRPEKLPDLVAQALADPEQSHLQAARSEYLEKWCASPDGNSCGRIARAMAETVKTMKPVNWQGLSFDDYRRAAKLKAFRALGRAYHFDPLLALKGAIAPDRYAIKRWTYEKSIKPGDIVAARARVEAVAAHRPAKTGS